MKVLDSAPERDLLDAFEILLKDCNLGRIELTREKEYLYENWNYDHYNGLTWREIKWPELFFEFFGQFEHMPTAELVKMLPAFYILSADYSYWKAPAELIRLCGLDPSDFPSCLKPAHDLYMKYYRFNAEIETVVGEVTEYF